jgi:acetate kinase|uniref:Acetate kinase n=1 Tax=Acidicaldus sp. TaxID=1872105 RepID=A0A8J4M6Z9_9PROT
MAEAVLVLNAGSSSIKFALYEIAAAGGLTATVHGQIEGIGTAPHLLAHGGQGEVLAERFWPVGETHTHEDLLQPLLALIESERGKDALIAAGHRVVHGGARHFGPALVTPALLDELTALVPLAPLHQPHNLAAIRAIMALRPELAEVACFDTAFHHGVAPVVSRLALPRQYADEGVRRYGFHGLSYEFIARRLRELEPDLAKGKVIAAHLGSGASLCAMQGGRSVDTTMGFTALDGLVMGTRCGSLDPGVVLYLQQRHGMDAAAIEDLLYHRSGLLGVSGISSDMRTLLASADPRANMAIELFVFRIAREIGALTATLGGLDGVVFTAGIGEHAPEIRAAVAARLGWLGATLDATANQHGTGRISTAESRIILTVIPTDEEAMIAEHTRALARGKS